MIFRVPLQLQVMDAVVHRLDVVGTRLSGPANVSPEGYDEIFHEPVVSDLSTGASVDGRLVTRVEAPPIRVPCQMETDLFGALDQAFSGNNPQNRVTLVMHRQDLTDRALIDTDTGNCLIRVGDRISRLERKGLGVPVITFEGDGLFVVESRPASFGFGPDGYDLHLIILERRDTAAR